MAKRIVTGDLHRARAALRSWLGPARWPRVRVIVRLPRLFGRPQARPSNVVDIEARRRQPGAAYMIGGSR